MIHQPALFPVETPKSIVNVASIPNRSTFRYPVGKTWLVPYIRQWLTSTRTTAMGVISAYPRLVEPFTGGGIVSLTALAEGFVEQVTMVERDEDVAAVWQTILDS